jgi:hypothetical protein
VHTYASMGHSYMLASTHRDVDASIRTANATCIPMSVCPHIRESGPLSLGGVCV